MAAKVLAEPLSIAINNSISTTTFLSNAKKVSVIPIDKKADDKHLIFNFRPVGTLNCFSKVYENVVKNKLVKSMEVHISHFISAYRKYNNMAMEEWREHLYNNKTMGVILMNLSRAFDCAPHGLLLSKVAAFGIDDNLILHNIPIS